MDVFELCWQKMEFRSSLDTCKACKGEQKIEFTSTIHVLIARSLTCLVGPVIDPHV